MIAEIFQFAAMICFMEFCRRCFFGTQNQRQDENEDDNGNESPARLKPLDTIELDSVEFIENSALKCGEMCLIKTVAYQRNRLFGGRYPYFLRNTDEVKATIVKSDGSHLQMSNETDPIEVIVSKVDNAIEMSFIPINAGSFDLKIELKYNYHQYSSSEVLTASSLLKLNLLFCCSELSLDNCYVDQQFPYYVLPCLADDWEASTLKLKLILQDKFGNDISPHCDDTQVFSKDLLSLNVKLLVKPTNFLTESSPTSDTIEDDDTKPVTILHCESDSSGEALLANITFTTCGMYEISILYGTSPSVAVVRSSTVIVIILSCDEIADVRENLSKLASSVSYIEFPFHVSKSHGDGDQTQTEDESETPILSLTEIDINVEEHEREEDSTSNSSSHVKKRKRPKKSSSLMSMLFSKTARVESSSTSRVDNTGDHVTAAFKQRYLTFYAANATLSLYRYLLLFPIHIVSMRVTPLTTFSVTDFPHGEKVLTITDPLGVDMGVKYHFALPWGAVARQLAVVWLYFDKKFHSTSDSGLGVLANGGLSSRLVIFERRVFGRHGGASDVMYDTTSGAASLTVTVDRARLLDDAMRRLMGVTAKAFAATRWAVTYRGERALDYGGVSRDFFVELCRGAFAQPLFVSFDGSDRLHPNGFASTKVSDVAKRMEFCGMLIARCLLSSRSSGACEDVHADAYSAVMPMTLSRSMLLYLTESSATQRSRRSATSTTTVSVDVLQIDHPELFDGRVKCLLELRRQALVSGKCADEPVEEIEELELPFAETITVGDCSKTYSLLAATENGRSMRIVRTPKDVMSYVTALANVRLRLWSDAHLQLIKKGFNRILPSETIDVSSYFDVGDMEKLLFGVAKVTGEELESHLEFHSTVPSSHVSWLRYLVRGLDEEMVSNFLQFVTGSPRLPPNGFAGLSPPISVRFVGDPPEGGHNLPTAATCSNQLNLPGYQRVTEMQRALSIALNYGYTGFGFS